MSLQYNRYAEVLIGDEEGIKISGLKIKFEVTKDLTGYPNLAKIEIYNLAASTRSRIKKEFDKVILNAGYIDSVKLLFKGQIRNVTHLKQSVDMVTTIYAHDGARDFDTARINETFKEGTNTKQVIESVVSSFKEVTLGVFEGVENLKEKLQGVSVSGSSKDVLDNLAKENNFEWSIENDVLNVVAKDKALDKIFKISSISGMIGSPTITEIGADVKMLLNPELIPNGQILIESITQAVSLGDLNFREVKKTLGDGLYKIQKITHNGDTHDNEWSSSVVGVTL